MLPDYHRYCPLTSLYHVYISSANVLACFLKSRVLVSAALSVRVLVVVMLKWSVTASELHSMEGMRPFYYSALVESLLPLPLESGL